MGQTWKLSPSDLTFLWSECRRCFYLKVARNLPRPRQPFPGIFIQIDSLMTRYFQDRPASDLAAHLPPGVVRYGQRWVTSAPIRLPGHEAGCFIKGRFDTAIEFADGSYGVVDFKTSTPQPHHVPFYGRQLHAYAYALEHPAPGCLELAPVSLLGLLCFEPSSLEPSAGSALAFVGQITWQECPKDYGQFLAFLDEVLTTLEQPSPPPGDARCPWCQYLAQMRTTAW